MPVAKTPRSGSRAKALSVYGPVPAQRRELSDGAQYPPGGRLLALIRLTEIKLMDVARATH